MILKDLKGRAALVTGSSGGIGTAVVEALLEQGCFVYGLDRKGGELESGRFRFFRCELDRPEQIEEAFRWLAQQVDSLDYLINLAGIDPKWRLEEGNREKWDQLIDLNLRGYYLVIREALALLRQGVGKSIVNIGSINYRLGVPKRSIYSVSKAGILGLTTGLARELGAEGIRINTVSPGWVFTPGQIEAYFQGEEAERNRTYLRRRQALDLEISPRDIARHVLFYLSEASRASTGHNCVVDAGWLLE